MTSKPALGDPNRCTIVITVHGRQKFLRRVTSYYADFDADVLVTDSSPQRAPAEYLVGPRLRYEHVPDEPYYQKMRRAHASATTPYVVECPDDDFILKRAICESVAIMDADPDVACVVGRTLRMSGKRGAIFGDTRSLQAQNLAFNRPDLCVLRRLIASMRFFTAYNHCVYRKTVLLQPFDLILAHRYLWPVRFFDKILAYVTVCAGKICFIDRPMCVRDETRLMNEPGAYPAHLEVDVPFSALPQRLEQADPLADLLQRSLPGSDVSRLRAFNRKLFRQLFGKGQGARLAPAIRARYERPLTAAHEREVEEVLDIVRRHWSFRDWLASRYLGLRGFLGRLRHRTKADGRA